MDLLAHLLHYFFVVPTSFFIILHCLYLLFHLYFFHHIFLCLEWWSFTFWCREDSHIPLNSYLMDVSLEILNLEGHLVRESSLTSLFESISISLCILREVHLLIFRVCASKRKKMKKNEKEKVINTCIQCHPLLSVYIGHWGCFIELVAYESSYVNFQKTLIFLCLSRYVFYVWQTSDIFLGTPNHCHLHHYMHWWFDCSSWLDLIGLALIHFPSIYLFLSWYFIRFAYIVLCSYQFTFHVQYFPHIILIHPISSLIFFISSLLSLIYSS